MDFRWALGSGVCEVLWESVRQRHEWDLQILCASISAPLGDIEQPGIPGGEEEWKSALPFALLLTCPVKYNPRSGIVKSIHLACPKSGEQGHPSQH